MVVFADNFWIPTTIVSNFELAAGASRGGGIVLLKNSLVTLFKGVCSKCDYQGRLKKIFETYIIVRISYTV